MRIFFDENVPRPLRTILDGHTVSFVQEMGWKGKRNGALLALVSPLFDVILSSDGSIEYQNKLHLYDLSMVVVPTNNLTLLRANAIALRATLDEVGSFDHRAIITIDWKGRRMLRRLDIASAEEVEIEAVPPFSVRRG